MRPRPRLLRSAKATTGLAAVGFFVLLAVIGPWITPYNPSGRGPDLLAAPSGQHWFGTTELGQDIFSQVLAGARPVVLIGFGAAAIATVLAVLVGVTAGYLGGLADESLSLLSNVFLVIPAVPLVVIVSSALQGASDLAVMLLIGLTSWAWGARVLRAQTLSLRRRDYVEAARAVGEPVRRIIGFEIIPNLSAVIMSSLVGNVMFAVMAEIVLAFIGVSGTLDWNWGTILYSAQSQQALAQGAWWWFAPAGLAVALLGTALALVNFGIDEVINPRLRGGARSAVRTASGRKERMRAGFTPVLDCTPAQRPATSAVVLSVENFSVDYGIGSAAVPAVRDVSLTLRRGEILGLAGESGSGKSSLAYGLTRLLPPPGIVRGGSVRYHPAEGRDPVDILAMSPAELRAFRWEQTAIVFQSALSALNPVHKIATAIMDVLAAHRPAMSAAARRDRASELLRMVGIPAQRLDSYPHELSGGMRQRVLIGMALALEPKIVILDEPTTALDMVTQRQILRQLIALKQRVGFAIVFITHDLGLLLEFADRIAVMYAGRIVENAPVAALRREPLHPYSRGLIGSFPPLRGERRTLSGIPGTPADAGAESAGCAFEPRCAKAFTTCSQRRPELGAPDPAEPERSVACWLHPAAGVRR